MMDIFNKLTQLAQQFELVIIGAVGAFLSLRFHPEVQGRQQVLIFVILGGAIAYFGTDLVAEYFSINSKRAGAIGFFLGVFGASLMDAIMKAIKSADVVAIIKTKLGIDK